MTRVLWGQIGRSLFRAASTFATLPMTSEMWASYESVSSTWTPGHLQLLTLSTECPSRDMCGSLGSKEIFCLVPVNRHLVLRTLRLRWLEPSHCFRLPKSWVRDENNFEQLIRVLEANVILVSSAYILTSDRRLQLGRSLMHNRNSRGPKIEPWGTPQLMKLVSEFMLFITVTWVKS